MNESDDRTSDLFELVERMLDSRISSDESERLNALLLGDPEARQTYAELMAIHAELQWQATAHGSVASSTQVNEPTLGDAAGFQEPLASRRSRFAPLAMIGDCFAQAGETFTKLTPFSIFVASLVMTGALVAASLIFLRHDPAKFAGSSGGSESSPEPTIIAWVTALDGTWKNAPAALPGAGLGPSKLELTQGMAQIRFNDGALALICAPTSLELVSGGRCRLIDGSLTARVPMRGRGFVVDTSAARIVDLGTEFGVDAKDQGDSVVHVFKGEVSLDPRNDESNRTHQVKAGESRRIAFLGAVSSPKKAERDNFLDGISFADHRAIVCDFSKGDGEFPGAAADGWASPWSWWTDQPADLINSPRILATADAFGGEKWLCLEMNGSDRSRGAATLVRQYGGFHDETLGHWRPRTIRFDLRLDAAMPSDGGIESCIAAMEHQAKKSAGAMGGTSWTIRAYCDERNGVKARHWTFMDGGDAKKSPEYVDSGMEAVPGRIYQFKVCVWPVARRWEATISDGERTVKSKDILGRSLQSRAEAGEGSGYIHFGARVKQNKTPIQFSIQRVSIEPTRNVSLSGRKLSAK